MPETSVTTTATVHDTPAALPGEHQEATLRALAAIDGLAWDDVTNRQRRRYEACIGVVLDAQRQAAEAAEAATPAGRELSWDDQLRAALAAEFPAAVLEVITESHAFGALSWKLRALADDQELTAVEALATITKRDRLFASHGADDPAAFLASRLPAY
jgi:hypothetical protein